MKNNLKKNYIKLNCKQAVIYFGAWVKKKQNKSKKQQMS